MPFTEDDLRELLLRLKGDAVASHELRNILRDPALERLQSEMAGLAAAERKTAERLEELAAAQRRTEERMGKLEERMAELAAAQLKTEERLGQLDERMAELAAAQRRTDERMAELAAAQRRTEERMAELAAAQRRTDERLGVLGERVGGLEERMAELAVAQRRTDESLAILTEKVGRLTDRMGGLIGESLERRYRERAGAYFWRVLRKTRVLDTLALEDALEERLSPDELYEGMLTDVIVSGKPRTRPDVEEVWLAVEVSSVVDRDDVRRALHRCRLLSRSGRPVVPVVAGGAITTGADEAARSEQVAVVEDGRFANWDEALDAALRAVA